LKLGIVYSKEGKEVIQDVNLLLEELYFLDVEVFVLEELEGKALFKNLKFFSSFESIIEESDFVISFGGDGTIIKFAKVAARFDKPILGINIGYLGFLASLERSQISEIRDILKGNFKTLSRMILEVNGLPSSDLLALNDVVISREIGSHISSYSVFQGSSRVCHHNADGIILSSPSGSTAYSFSAGGPIIDPNLNCIAITPICPHSLNSRSFIVSAEEALEIEYFPKKGSRVHVFIDGKPCFSSEERGRILINRSKLRAKFINLPSTDFYKTIDKKLMGKF